MFNQFFISTTTLILLALSSLGCAGGDRTSRVRHWWMSLVRGKAPSILLLAENSRAGGYSNRMERK
jgi:hypothetical protein